MSDKVIAYIDGGSRGNPGPAAAGFILTDPAGARLQAGAVFLGRATNNIAEYSAIVKALEAAKRVGAEELTVFSDSELLVKQINGQYRVKSERIRVLFRQAVNLLGEFKNWEVRHITREQNRQADELVNRALNLERDVPHGTRDEYRASSIEHREKPLRLGVLISGGGTTLMNILEYVKQAPLEGWYPQNGPLSSPAKRQAFLTGQGRLNAEIAVVISSRSHAGGVERARAAGLDVKIIRRKAYPGIDEFSRRIEAELAAAEVELVVQGGWLCLWKIPARYENRVMNIHPALLPGPVRKQVCAKCVRRRLCKYSGLRRDGVALAAGEASGGTGSATQAGLSNRASFGGKGMWGHYVHEAVLAAGCKISGCTVHFCTNEYDKGPIIVQRTCEVRETDNPEALAARVFEQECIAYPQAIKLFAEGKITS